VGFYSNRAPSAAQLASVKVVRVVRGGAILVSATRSNLGDGVRVAVQLQAECAR
jgi:hypothetical protein